MVNYDDDLLLRVNSYMQNDGVVDYDRMYEKCLC